ncbi:MAG: sulfotransferase [Hyphomicrobiaceae bacterium]
MRKPNLFVIGAPKTGTTALAKWLSGHPAVFFSEDKEPNFFSTDFRLRKRPSEAEYSALFSGATETHRYVAEGSTRYLASTVAVPAIEKWCAAPKYIAIVRNPVELVHSLHNHHVFLNIEQHEDFGKAWHMSEARARDEDIVPNCTDPDSLVYTRMGMLGEQISRLFETVPEERRKVMVYDDLKRDGAAFYRDALAFLGLEDDQQDVFEPVNVSMAQRSRFVAGAIDALAAIKEASGIKRSFNILAPIQNINRADRPREIMSPALSRELKDYFRDDVALLSSLLGHDLSAWTAA